MKTVFMIAAGCVCNIMISAVFGSFGTYVPYIMGYLRIYQPALKYRYSNTGTQTIPFYTDESNMVIRCTQTA